MANVSEICVFKHCILLFLYVSASQGKDTGSFTQQLYRKSSGEMDDPLRNSGCCGSGVGQPLQSMSTSLTHPPLPSLTGINL